MDIQELKQSLKNLHARLDTAGPVDAELQELLRTLDADIQLLLARRTANAPVSVAADDEDIAPGSLAERSQEIGARFAVEHPQLEPALRELGRILANMGI